jgi:hypothetical protein
VSGQQVPSESQAKFSTDAIELKDADIAHLVDLLVEIPGAYEQAQLGLDQAKEGRTIALDEL